MSHKNNRKDIQWVYDSYLMIAGNIQAYMVYLVKTVIIYCVNKLFHAQFAYML